MIKLKQYKESIHKCSKCGLCQESCPVYIESGNECDTARGMLILLKGIINGEVPLRGKINKYLDKCLRCGKCFDVCPSEIPVEDIIFAAKCKYLYTSLGGLKIRILQSALFKRLFSKPKKVVSEKFDTKALYFGGNFKDALKLLNANSIELLNPVELEWGAEYVLSGNIIRFRKCINEVMHLIAELNPKFIITDIPADKFKSIIKTYGGYCPNLEIKYLGEYQGGEELVSHFFNPLYAEKLVKELKAKVHQ